MVSDSVRKKLRMIAEVLARRGRSQFLGVCVGSNIRNISLRVCALLALDEIHVKITTITVTVLRSSVSENVVYLLNLRCDIVQR